MSEINSFDFQFFLDLFPEIIPMIKTTLLISIVSLIFTLMASTVISVIRYFKVPIITNILNFFISFFRSVPLVALLYLLYFGLCSIIPAWKDMSPFTATVIALTVNTTAFMSENFRGAFESVEKGQLEACYSMGMTKIQTMVRTVIPQAFLVALPMIGNQFIGIIKGSALGFTVGLLDIMAKAKLEASLALRFFEAYLAVSIIYFVLVMILEKIQKKFEEKIKIPL